MHHITKPCPGTAELLCKRASQTPSLYFYQSRGHIGTLIPWYLGFGITQRKVRQTKRQSKASTNRQCVSGEWVCRARPLSSRFPTKIRFPPWRTLLDGDLPDTHGKQTHKSWRILAPASAVEGKTYLKNSLTDNIPALYYRDVRAPPWVYSTQWRLSKRQHLFICISHVHFTSWPKHSSPGRMGSLSKCNSTDSLLVLWWAKHYTSQNSKIRLLWET